jgi:hypothetical protein
MRVAGVRSDTMRATTDTPRTTRTTSSSDGDPRCARPRRTLTGLLVAALAPLALVAALDGPAVAVATVGLLFAAAVAAVAGRTGLADGPTAVGHPGRSRC